MSCTKIITLAFISLELFSLIIFPYNFYNLKTIRNISMKLGTLIKHNEIMCHTKEP